MTGARWWVPVIAAGMVIGAVLLAVGPDDSPEQGSKTEEPAESAEVPQPTPSRPRDPAAGDFYYLLDVSQSVAGTRSASHERGIEAILKMIRGMPQLADALPQLHRVGTISSLSLGAPHECEVYAPAITIFSAADTAAFQGGVRECQSRLDSLGATSYTDIRGALARAGYALAGSDARVRGVVVVSDLDEDLPPGATPATPQLEGICVYLVALITPEVTSRPELLDERREHWIREVSSWGARGVESIVEPGLNPTSATSFFRQCSRGRR